MYDFIDMLNQFELVDEELTSHIFRRIQRIQVKKNALILDENEKEPGLYFVAEGVLATFYRIRGETVCTGFGGKGDTLLFDRFFKCPNTCFNENIIALERSIIHVLPFAACNHLQRYFKRFDYYVTNLLLKKCEVQKLHLRLLEERDLSRRPQRFIEYFPDLAGKISIRWLSYYLRTSVRTIHRKPFY